jgi:hypothetical protein
VTAGQDQVGEGAVPGGGQDPEPDGEDQDEQDADPEGRGGLAEQDAGHHGVVGAPAAAHGGEDAGRDRHHEGHGEGGGGQFDGGREPVGEDLADGLSVDEGVTEVEPDQSPQVVEVLGEEGLVQAERVAQHLLLFGRGVRRQQDLHGVAGEAYEEEGDGRRAEQDEQGGGEAPGDSAQRSRPVPSARGCLRRGGWRVEGGGAHRDTSALSMARTPADPGVQRGRSLRAKMLSIW